MNAKSSLLTWATILTLALCSQLSCVKHRRTTKNLNDPKYACSVEGMLDVEGPEAARRCAAFLVDDLSLSVEQKYVLGESLDAQGEPGRAFGLFKEVILTAHKKKKFAPEAVAASMAMVAQRGRVPRFDGTFMSLMDELNAQRGTLPRPAWYQLRNLHWSILRKQGEVQGANAARDQLGCLTDWQTAGPFGPHIWSGFDQVHPLETKDRWPKSVQLGFRPQPSPVGDARVTQCNVIPGDPQIDLQGTVISRTKVRLEKDGRVYFRLQTGLAASLLIDGREVNRRDPREEHPAYVQWFQVKLEAGVHSISLKLSGTNPASQFSLVAMNEKGLPAFTEAPLEAPVTGTVHLEDLQRLGPLHNRAGNLLPSLRVALWWDDHLALNELWQKIPQDAPINPLLQSLLAETRFINQSLPGDLAYEEARALYEQALLKEPRLVSARLKLSDHASMEARTDENLKLLSEGTRLSPREPEYLSRLAGFYLAEGWYPEAQEAIEKLGRLLPASCDAMLWKLALARSLGRAMKASKLAEEIYQCDRLSTELLDEQTRSLKLSGAQKTASALIELFPASPSFRERQAYLEMSRGNLEGFETYIQEALALDPKNTDLYLRLADSQMARGNLAEARATVEDAIARTPRPAPMLLRANAHLAGRDSMGKYRVDGLEIVEEYKKNGASYQAASVYVLDRAVYLYEDDGSNTILVHTIMHLTSDEAVEAHGEVQIPENAEALLARTIKPDGRILETAGIEGKPTLSLPNILPGDFIEVEYIAYNSPNLTYPGGFDSERFFFQDFQTAFHNSQIVVVVPSGINVTEDPRGPCPKATVDKKGRHKIYTWKAQERLPHIEEPFGPAPVEYLPSIRVVSNVDITNIAARIQDMMADKSVPALIGSEIVRRVCPEVEDKKDCRRRLYHWVLREIDPSGDPFEQASHILHRRMGDRNRTLAFLLESLGDRPRLAIVQTQMSDQTANATPSVNQFVHTALFLEDEGWLSLDVDDAPFGYLLPELRAQRAVFIDTGEMTQIGPSGELGDIQRVSIHVASPKGGETTIRITERLRGQTAANWRTMLKEGSPENIHKVFREQYVSLEIPGAVLEDLSIDHLNHPDKDLILTYKVSLPGYLTPRNDHFVGRSLFASGLFKGTGALPARVTDLVMPMHLIKEVEILVDRAGYRDIEIPNPTTIPLTSKWGSLELNVSSTGSTIGYRYKLSLDMARISVDDYTEFAAFAKEVDLRTQIEPVFDPQ